MTEYLAELRKLAAHCKFENKLDDTLRDRFVCGLRDEAVRRRLVAEKDLTLTKALELSQAMETAAQHAKQLRENEPVSQVINKIRLKSQGPTTNARKCYRCGETNHRP